MKTDIDQLKKKLSPKAFKVMCEEDTEPPFQNAYWDNHEDGIYVDAATGKPLFSSLDKFDSGTGWPSFKRTIDGAEVATKIDTKFSMQRVEIHTAQGLHLGHIFDDGPGPDGKRFCINSASLKFIPKKELAAHGLERYLPLFQNKSEIRK